MKTTSSILCRTSMMAVLAFTVLVPFNPAQAYVPPCETTECPTAGPKAWAAVTSAVEASLATLESDMYEDFIYFMDAVTRLANQHSNNRQNTLKAFGGINDRDISSRTSFDMGQQRATLADQVFPSRTACQVAGRRTLVENASFSSNAAVGAAETVNTGILSNAPATGGNLGQLGYSVSRFQGRMTKYCNTSTVSPPGSIPCTATIGADRDLFPYDSIFKQTSMAAANDYTAAKDVIYNIMGDAVKDPVRGPLLTRQEGQNLSIQRYSEQSQINLAASVLQSMVERRRNISGTGSQQTLQADASYTGMAARKLAEINAGQSDGQNLDTVSAMFGDTSRSIFMLRDFFEQWAALKAVSLAIDIKQNSAGNGSVAGRPVNN